MKHTFCILRYFGLFILSLLLNPAIQAQQLMPSGKAENEKISLNGVWKFRLYIASTIGQDTLFYQPRFDTSKWSDITVPGHWELQGFSKPYYGKVRVDGTGLYRREFSIPASWNGNPVYMAFDGVLYGYSVWVNGNFAGKFTSAYNRHTFDISKFVKAGEKNILAVRVDKLPRGWEFDIFDCWSVSGIYRDVTLFTLPNVHINDVVVKTHLNGSFATLDLKTILERTSNSKFSNKLEVSGRLLDENGKVVKEFALEKFEPKLKSDKKTFICNVQIDNPKLWTSETPHLYNLEILVKDKNKMLQQYSQKIGIREITWDNAVLRLNGTPVKLRGVDHHDLTPVNGRAVTEAEILQDLKLMREANINFIRTSHYPPHPRLLELCDSLGFYVMDEVPFGWGDDLLTDKSYLPNLLTRAQSTVERDKNHPCILIWSIGNENPFTPICFEAGKKVKALDETRPICYPQVGSYFGKNFSNNIPDSVDVLAPHYPRVNDLKNWAVKFEKPMIVSEYAHSFGLDFGTMEDEWEIMYASPKLAGGAIWHFFDQGILRTSDKKISKNEYTEYVWKDSLTYYDTGEIREGVDGIVYADRTPQVDYWQVRKVYSPVMPLGDTLVYNKENSGLSFKLNNRYDFTNLSEIKCDWELYADAMVLKSGNCKLDCNPHDTTLVTINTAIPEGLNAGYLYLKLKFSDKKNYQLNEKVYTILTGEKAENLLAKLTEKMPEPVMKNNQISCENYTLTLSSLNGNLQLNNKENEPVIIGGPYARINRKPTMASRKLGDFLQKKNEASFEKIASKTQKIYYKFIRNKPQEPSLNGYVEYAFSDSGSIKINYRFMPDSAQKINTTETGISFLLPASMTEFRWIGKGPYASYPGKTRLNEFGIHHLTAADIYFQGNRAGVDCAVFSDKAGNGFVLLADKANIAVECTPEGILVSHNVYVSGRYNKGNTPELFYSFENIKEMNGSFIIVPIAKNWKPALEKLVGKPGEKVIPFTPFYNSYDQN